MCVCERTACGASNSADLLSLEGVGDSSDLLDGVEKKDAEEEEDADAAEAEAEAAVDRNRYK